MARLLVNPIARVFYAGFETTTDKLAHHGWHVSIDEDVIGDRYTLMLFHPPSDIKLFGESRDRPRRDKELRAGYAYNREYRNDFAPSFNIFQAVTGCRIMRLPEFRFDHWNETRPSLIDVDERDIMSFPIFQELNKPVAEQLIVEPQDVMQLLEKIKQMQAPTQAEIRERERRRENTPTVHATILSFQGAA